MVTEKYGDLLKPPVTPEPSPASVEDRYGDLLSKPEGPAPEARLAPSVPDIRRGREQRERAQLEGGIPRPGIPDPGSIMGQAGFDPRVPVEPRRPLETAFSPVNRFVIEPIVALSEAIAQGIPYSVDELFDIEQSGLLLPPGGPQRLDPDPEVLRLIRGQQGVEETGQRLLEDFGEKSLAAQIATGIYDPTLPLPIPLAGATGRLASGGRRLNLPSELPRGIRRGEATLADRALIRPDIGRQGRVAPPQRALSAPPVRQALPPPATSLPGPLGSPPRVPPGPGVLPPFEPSVVIVDAGHPQGQRLVFGSERDLRRGVLELGQRDVTILPAEATVRDVQGATARLGQGPPGVTIRGIERRAGQRGLPAGLDPEQIDVIRGQIRSRENELRLLTDQGAAARGGRGLLPNSPLNQSIQAKQTQLDNLRQSLAELTAPQDVGLDVAGVIRQEPFSAGRRRTGIVPPGRMLAEPFTRPVRDPSLGGQFRQTIRQEPIQAVDRPLGGPRIEIDVPEVPRITSNVVEPPIVIPSRNNINLFGLHPIEAGLGRLARYRNTFRSSVERVGIATTPENQFATGVINERRRVQPIINSQSTRMGTIVDETIRRGGIVVDNTGRMADLRGIDSSIRGAPTVADVAARLPRFAAALGPQRLQAFEELRQVLAPFRQATDEIGLDIGLRPDVIEGGFYIPRAVRSEGPRVAGSRRRRPPSGFMQEAEFPSQAFGIDQGTDYLPVGEAVRRYANQTGRETLDAHTARFLATLGDEGTNVARGNTIDIPGIRGTSFDTEMANAINQELAIERRLGRNVPFETINAINKLYLGFRATADNSALMIQGLLGLANDPRNWGRALRTNIRAWMRNGDRALGQYIIAHDNLARQRGMPSVQEWNSAGLQTGGAATEFTLGQGPTAALGQLPLIRQANRAFGAFGDTMRVAWADSEVEGLIRRGVTGDELRGQMERIARVVNGATGFAQGKTFADMGDILLLAPRFLQSRLETTARGVMGLRPGATLEQRIARRSLLKLIGIGTGMTFAINEALGQETDTRPFVTIKTGTRPLSTPDPITGRTTEDIFEKVPNSNFMRVRFGGRDWSMFGTWDSLLRVIMAGGSGDPIGAIRPLASGTVSVSIDVLTGRDFNSKVVPTNIQAIMNQPGRFAEWVGGQIYPFAAEEIPSAVRDVFSGEAAAGITTIVGEIIGAKSSPLSRRDRRNVIAQNLYALDYDDPRLTAAIRRAIRELNDE